METELYYFDCVHFPLEAFSKLTILVWVSPRGPKYSLNVKQIARPIKLHPHMLKILKKLKDMIYGASIAASKFAINLSILNLWG